MVEAKLQLKTGSLFLFACFVGKCLVKSHFLPIFLFDVVLRSLSLLCGKNIKQDVACCILIFQQFISGEEI